MFLGSSILDVVSSLGSDVDFDMINREVNLASSLVPRIVAIFFRKTDTEEKVLNTIEMDIQKFISTLRNNESLKCFVNRMDDGKKMRLDIGFSDHEEMRGIVACIRKMIVKAGHDSGLKVKVGIF